MAMPCGTNAAYVAHKKRGEKACEPCRVAHASVTARSSIIRGRAQRRLAGMYPDVFAALISEEEIRYEREAT